MCWCLFAVELLCLIHLSFPTCWSVFHRETPIILHFGKRWIDEELSFSRVLRSLNHSCSSTGHPPAASSTSTQSSTRSHTPPAPVSESGWVPEPRERERAFLNHWQHPLNICFYPGCTRTYSRSWFAFTETDRLKRLIIFNQIPSFILIKQSSRHRNANMPEWWTSIRN